MLFTWSMTIATRETRSAPARSGIAIGALVLAAALWSLNGVLIKFLYAGGESAGGVAGVTLAAYRSLVGGFILVPFAIRRLPTLRSVPPFWPLFSIATFTLMTSTFVIANTMTAAANAIVLQYTSPIWVFALSPLILGERPTRRDAAVLVLAMIGVAILFGGNAGSPAALAVGLCSGLGYGTLTVVLRRQRTVDPTVVTVLNAIGSGLILLPAVAIWGRFAVSPSQAAVIALMGLVQFTLPYVLFSWALRHTTAQHAALIVLLETILNPLWVWLFLGEVPPHATLAGAPFILAASVGWTFAGRRRAADAAP